MNDSQRTESRGTGLRELLKRLGDVAEVGVAIAAIAAVILAVLLLVYVIVLLNTPSTLSVVTDSLKENIGSLLISLLAVLLGAWALYQSNRLTRRRLEFEREKFKAEAKAREEHEIYRKQQYEKFSEPAADLAHHIANLLRQDSRWAREALEAAKLAGYSDTLFGERSQHFKAEKEELAKRFVPYLMSRCRALIGDGSRQVCLLVDAGTTLYPFFRLIGEETAKASQRREEWIKNLHLATNNLPGLEDLMRSGRQVQNDRYSKLAIEGCHLLPGVPLPVFAAVAGEETKSAIKRLRESSFGAASEEVIFIGLVVGNWVRIRNRAPRCPIPMARGVEHKEVKDTLVEACDEVFVVSPLGKIFVGVSNETVNEALDFEARPVDQALLRYDEVEIDNQKATRVKLVSTRRQEGRILAKHGYIVESALVSSEPEHGKLVGEKDFAQAKIEELPHLLFPFNNLPDSRYSEFETEFPHYKTRSQEGFLRMFSVRMPGGGM